jgi:hypothetical protein
MSCLAILLLLLAWNMPSAALQAQESQRRTTENRTAQDSQDSKTQGSDSSQNSTPQDKALAAKNELSKKLLADTSVVGVGIGSQHSFPIIYVYVTPEASKSTLAHIPKKCQGVPVSVVKTEPLKPQ